MPPGAVVAFRVILAPDINVMTYLLTYLKRSYLISFLTSLPLSSPHSDCLHCGFSRALTLCTLQIFVLLLLLLFIIISMLLLLLILILYLMVAVLNETSH